MHTVRKWLEKLQCSDSVLNRSHRMQLAATLIVNILTFGHGVSIGWLSPTLVQLLSAETPLQFQLVVEEISWIGSLLGLGSVFGNIFVGFLLYFVSDKICMYLIAIPQMCMWILIYLAQSQEYLYVARFLGGFTSGASFVVLPVFVSEIADLSIRGTLASMLLLSKNFGILSGYILSSHLSYHTVPCIVVFLPIVYTIGIIFFPSTPRSLLRKGENNAAETSWQFYKNIKSNCSYDEMLKFKEEFNQMKAELLEQNKNKLPLSCKDFTSRTALKAFATSAVILFANQFSGSLAFLSYMSNIFLESGSSLTPNTSTIIVGAVQILGAYSATLFVDRFGRRILLLLSSGGATLALTMFGVFSFYAKRYDLSEFGWVPVLLMSLNIYLCNCGIVSMTFVVLVELFPSKIRTIAMSACMTWLSVLAFVVLKIFPLYMAKYGVAVTMWSCAAACGSSFFYLLIFLPETKRKSLNT